MRKAIYCFVALMLFSISACVQEENFLNQDFTGEIHTVTVVGPEAIEFEPVTDNAPTKGTSIDNGTALNFNWVVGDTLGIFPNKGNQVEFPISSTDGSTSASFDGGGWALRNNSSYAAYYPFSVWNYHRDNETIMLDYSGQVQDGNGSFSHLSAYDYLASVKTTPMNSSVTFNMERQGSILYIDIVVPEAETIRELVVSCDDEIFVEKASLDISGDSPVVTPVKMSSKLTLSLENTATTEANETIRAYMAVHPLDFSDKTVTATLVTESGRYAAPVTPRIVNKGKAAFLRFSDDFTPVNIDFADAEVKRICVENWDTDGDGELSYKEAAAVTDLGTVFKENKIISTFNELVYFTGLTEIGNDAFYFSSLKSVVIPENVSIIGSHAFSLTNLSVIEFPNSLLSIGFCAFQSTKLKYVDLPETVIEISEGVFDLCEDLEYFSGKYASSDGNSLVVDGKLKAMASAGISEYLIPSDVNTICYRSISNTNGNISKLIIPDGVEIIEAEAIVFCKGITDINLPNSIITIGENNFIGCDNLGQFKGQFACDNGRCLVFESTLIAVAEAGLTEYVIPEDVTRIGQQAFYYFHNLTSVTLHEKITDIGFAAFNSCGITQITLPSALKIIGWSSFFSCVNLTELIIPAGVESISSFAFKDCIGLSKISVNIKTPFAIEDDVFDNTNNCPIYVPNESLEAYKTTPGWSEYADRIFGIEVEGSVVGPGTENPE